ncbi:ADP-forming succinate--CoA ligase subunit beta [Hydrogenibacillus schlegelii]|uniref:Succinate--CoA ligase [ADP-forming] subunit beta n=1 Tax=Hydrogenibacillus schlegelii TaxID=1484 RepID=A0A132N9P4_HYDSH|nr:ADP-forming succinate--CoA ligase subunit beta [Hydrogenibacillus schlegelii]KWX06814.1 succinyl-CoA synthetase subunit beta [Hydrogenibacillus schlegelii]MBT9281468.1 ADP-forming succinate--CoA ligase subunit beta [Hydrogenibacillus schlegelii]OAR04689.1 succinyl-CoA synthetase subunit beta [Hydrogenibacillus schlegelii]PTQ54931.1 MAG: Succinyl-CoA ligase [ADP-forming] beta chain [Hydrogenibacillus schlegelii]
MNVHEYQAKALLRESGVPVPRGEVATSAEEAVEIARRLGGDLWVVKAQIHAGGRGKAGGVKLARSLDEVRAHAEALLGRTLVTHQTGPEGKVVRKVLVEEGTAIEREFYIGAVVDRATGRVVVMASSEGGVEIEAVAARAPEKIVKETVDPAVGLMPYQARKLAYAIGLPREAVGKAVPFFLNLYRVFVEKDASLAEINPLVLTRGGELVALDAKFNFDDNALFRRPEVAALRDLDEEDPKEVEASKYGLSYIALDGNIGCMVNGAGLAMATMDIIQFYGGRPANFLDVGGGASKEKVTAAFKIILADPNVKGIFVNIFGGIMKCDIIAEGIVAAAREVGLDRPLVVRLEGTNVELGKAILDRSGLPIISADTMADGAQKIVEIVGKGA